MKRICIGAVALLSAHPAALAGANHAGPSFRDIARYDTELVTLYPFRYVRNPNNCGPDLSRAVWCPNGVILGYACYRDSNR